LSRTCNYEDDLGTSHGNMNKVYKYQTINHIVGELTEGWN